MADSSTKVDQVPRATREHADVAQLVAHHLAKVRVASSSLVIRSSVGVFLRRVPDTWVEPHRTTHGGVAERLGTGLQSRLHGFESRRHLAHNFIACIGAIGAAVARFPDTEEVTGSIPVSRTDKAPVRRGFFVSGRSAWEIRGRSATDSELGDGVSRGWRRSRNALSRRDQAREVMRRMRRT